MKLPIFPTCLLLGMTLVFAGCSKHESHSASAGHNHDHASEHTHVHAAPHGGTLIALGDHQFNLEFILDSRLGKLTAYALDAHAENFIRLSAPSLEIHVTSPAPARTLVLNAAANTATGETVGNTSQFEASADWLKGATGVSGSLDRIEAQGSVFQNVSLDISPPPAPGN